MLLPSPCYRILPDFLCWAHSHLCGAPASPVHTKLSSQSPPLFPKLTPTYMKIERWAVVKIMSSVVRLHEAKFRFRPWRVAWPQASYITCLYLSFSICEMRLIIIIPSQSSSETQWIKARWGAQKFTRDTVSPRCSLGLVKGCSSLEILPKTSDYKKNYKLGKTVWNWPRVIAATGDTVSEPLMGGFPPCPQPVLLLSCWSQSLPARIPPSSPSPLQSQTRVPNLWVLRKPQISKQHNSVCTLAGQHFHLHYLKLLGRQRLNPFWDWTWSLACAIVTNPIQEFPASSRPPPKKNNNNLLLKMNSPGIAGMETGLGEVGAHPVAQDSPIGIENVKYDPLTKTSLFRALEACSVLPIIVSWRKNPRYFKTWYGNRMSEEFKLAAMTLRTIPWK